jgi:hypothetical protein
MDSRAISLYPIVTAPNVAMIVTVFVSFGLFPNFNGMAASQVYSSLV